MSIFEQSIVKLKRNPGFFIPSRLRQALRSYEPVSANETTIYRVMDAFIHYKKNKNDRYYTSSTLIDFDQEIQQIINHTYQFRRDDLIHLHLIEQHPHDHIICGWLVLLRVGLYNMANQEQIRRFCNTAAMAKGLYVLAEAQLLNQATLDFMLRHQQPLDALSTVFILKHAQQLNHLHLSQFMHNDKSKLGHLLHTIWYLNSTLITSNLAYLLTLPTQSIQWLQQALDEFIKYTLATSLDQILLNSFFIAMDELSEHSVYPSKKAIFEALSHAQLLPCSKEAMSALLLDKNNDNTQSIIDIIQMLHRSGLPFGIGSTMNTIIVRMSANAMKPIVTILKQKKQLNERLLITCAQHKALRQLINLLFQTAPHCLNTTIIKAIQKPHVAQELLNVWHPDLTRNHILEFCNHPYRWQISLSTQHINAILTSKELFIFEVFLACKHASCVQIVEALVVLLSSTPLLTAIHLHHAVDHLNDLPPLIHKTEQDILKSTLLYIQQTMNNTDQTDAFSSLLNALAHATNTSIRSQTIHQYLYWRTDITSPKQEAIRQTECTL